MEIDQTDLPRPTTVRDAVEILLEDLDSDTLSGLRDTVEADLIIHHMGVGRFIRNLFGLHGDNQALLSNTGASNADDASMVLVEELWRRLRLH